MSCSLSSFCASKLSALNPRVSIKRISGCRFRPAAAAAAANAPPLRSKWSQAGERRRPERAGRASLPARMSAKPAQARWAQLEAGGSVLCQEAGKEVGHARPPRQQQPPIGPLARLEGVGLAFVGPSSLAALGRAGRRAEPTKASWAGQLVQAEPDLSAPQMGQLAHTRTHSLARKLCLSMGGRRPSASAD